jgi:hypothetical protein
MDRLAGKSGTMMSRGAMQMRHNPPSFVATIRTFHNKANQKTVTLYPIPNFASPAYFRRTLISAHTDPKFDTVLCEDGRLPYLAGTTEGRRTEFWRRVFPFIGYRPVVADARKFDGLVQRDAVESRMAYMSLTEGMEPSVDPRSRRALERIETYPQGQRVVMPWNIYHHVYLAERLPQHGYELVNAEEVVVVDTSMIAVMMISLMVLTFYTIFTFLRLLFGY